MRLVDLGDARLAVHEWGRDGDVPFLFWHALGPAGSGAELGEIAPILVDAGFHPFAVDAPGFGRSPLLPPERYRLPALVALVRALVSELELDRPVVAGHSWGGAIAVSYAAAHPDDVRALVLLDSGHIDYRELPDVDGDASPEDWIESARERDARWESREAFEAWLRDGLKRPTPALLRAYGAGVREEAGAILGSPAEARGAAMAGMTAPVSDAWPVLAANDIPTLLLLATEPPHVDQNREHLGRFRAALPAAEVRWVDGAGHGILADAGPAVGEQIADWLVDQGL